VFFQFTSKRGFALPERKFREKNSGAFLARRAKNRAFRSNSSDLLMQILWGFRFNPLRGPGGFPLQY
jgi:hypothetical protein